MQRSIPVTEINEVISLVKKTRDAINAYLGRQHYVIAEELNHAYVYPSDVSMRLTKLQALVGHILLETKDKPCLLDIIKSSVAAIDKCKPYWKDTLNKIVYKLLRLMIPQEDFPPIKKPLLELLDSSVDNLIAAIVLLSGLIEKEASELAAHAELLERADAPFNDEMSLDQIIAATERYEQMLAQSSSTLFYKSFEAAEMAEASGPSLNNVELPEQRK